MTDLSMEEFERVVMHAKTRLDAAQHRPEAQVDDLLHQLQVAVEELDVAQEELRVQQDALTAAGERIEQERHRYRLLFTASPAALVLTDRDGMIVEVNTAAADLLGLDPARLPRTSLFSHLHPDGRGATRRLLLRTPPGQTAVTSVRLDCPDAPAAQVRLTVLPDGEGTLWSLTTTPGERAPLSGTREVAMLELLGQLIAAVTGEFDVIEMLSIVCDRLCDVIGIDACGVLLVADDGQIRVAATSGLDARQVEMLQVDSGTGPCVEALRSGQPVVVDSPAGMAQAWPALAGAFRQQGLAAVAAIPLPGAEGPMGTLNVFRAEPVGFASHDLTTLAAVARVVVQCIANARVVDDTRRQAEHLRHALASRVVIEQAKGIVARDRRVDMTTAFELLRGTARRQRRRLHELAEAVIDGWVDPADLR